MRHTRTRRAPRRLATLALALVLGLILAACGGDDAAAPADDDAAAPADDDAAAPADDAGDGGEATAPDPSDVELLTVAHFGGLPTLWIAVRPYVAEHFGFYDKYGANVEHRPMRSGGDIIQATFTGEISGGHTGTEPFLTAAAQGVNVKGVIGEDIQDWILVTRDPDIQSCEDMEGKRSGSQAVGDARWLVLNVILESCGVSIDDVDTVDTSGDHIGPLVGGVLDTHVLHVDERAIIEAQTDDEWRVITSLAEVDPGHYAIYVFNEETINDNREGLVRWLAAMIDATRFMFDPANHEAITEYLVTNEIVHTTDVEVGADILRAFVEMPQWHTDHPGMSPEYLEPSIESQVRAGNIDEAYPVEDIVDESLWYEALERVEAAG